MDCTVLTLDQCSQGTHSVSQSGCIVKEPSNAACGAVTGSAWCGQELQDPAWVGVVVGGMSLTSQALSALQEVAVECASLPFCILEVSDQIPSVRRYRHELLRFFSASEVKFRFRPWMKQLLLPSKCLSNHLSFTVPFDYIHWWSELLTSLMYMCVCVCVCVCV
jgi:hypothetical protein